MARIKNLDQITGNLKNLSFYTRKGSTEIFVRTKGGPSKEKISRDPAFKNLRQANKEFGGCSKMSKQIRMAFYGLEHVAEINLAPALCGVAKVLQKADTTSQKGERKILLSQLSYLLTGFDFGRDCRFNNIFRVPLQYSISRDEQMATIDIPAFDCDFGINIIALKNHLQKKTLPGHFRFHVALGIVTDMCLNESKSAYVPVHDKLGHGFKTVASDWFSMQSKIPEQKLQINIFQQEAVITVNDSFVLTIIIEFGLPDWQGKMYPAKGIGCGMIISVV